MDRIPIRHIIAAQKETDLSEGFGIRDLRDMLAGEDMVQEYHRHDFFYMLVLEKGSGSHDIDFTPYVISDHAVFFMRPGQVHRLVLKAGSTGYMMQFSEGFCFSHTRYPVSCCAGPVISTTISLVLLGSGSCWLY